MSAFDGASDHVKLAYASKFAEGAFALCHCGLIVTKEDAKCQNVECSTTFVALEAFWTKIISDTVTVQKDELAKTSVSTSGVSGAFVCQNGAVSSCFTGHVKPAHDAEIAHWNSLNMGTYEEVMKLMDLYYSVEDKDRNGLAKSDLLNKIRNTPSSGVVKTNQEIISNLAELVKDAKKCKAMGK